MSNLVIKVTVRDDNLVTGTIGDKEYTRPRNSKIFQKYKFADGESVEDARRLALAHAQGRWSGTKFTAEVVEGTEAHGAPLYRELA